MDQNTLQKINNLMGQLSVEADKTIHDSKNVYQIMHSSHNVISLLLTHIGYLESKIDNLNSEVQRLSSISQY
jgi:hypothetical protein